MASQTTLFILGGCLLGLFQLLVGISIGVWIRRSRAEVQRERAEIQQASMIAEQLKLLADEMSSSAIEHRTQLEQASRQLQSDAEEGETGVATVVANVIGDIVHANHNLQSQLATAETRLAEQAVEIQAHISRSLTDPLTGLPNRRAFNDRLEERMSAWRRRQEPFSLLLLDVDHFKALNDQHGHRTGDAVLAAVGRVLRGAVRREDAVARYGGEEFAVLLPDITAKRATQVAEQVREAVARMLVNHDGKKIAITISGGLAAIEGPDTAETLIEKADAALYVAKASGRNRTCVHGEGGMGGDMANSLQLVQLIEGTTEFAVPAANVSQYQPYLPGDRISEDLAEACNELRRLVADRALSNPATQSVPSKS